MANQEKSQTTDVTLLFEQLRDWRSYWNRADFLSALFLGLLLSAFDSGTDLDLAASYPEECGLVMNMTTICGPFYPKALVNLTYTFCAWPGIVISLSGLQRFLSFLAHKHIPGRYHSNIASGIASAFYSILVVACLFALAEISLRDDLYKLSWSHLKKEFNLRTDNFTVLVRTLAYLSTTLILGAKCIGLFSHGSETKKLNLHFTTCESQCESTMQVLLIGVICITSGTFSEKSLLSGILGLLFICLKGVVNFGTNNMGPTSCKTKFTALLFLFLFSTIFKIGTLVCVVIWSPSMYKWVFVALAICTPFLALLMLKKFTSFLDDIQVSHIFRGSIGELGTIHYWKSKYGRKIGLGVATFHLLLYSSALVYILAHPSPVMTKHHAPGTLGRLRTTAATCLVLGILGFFVNYLYSMSSNVEAASIHEDIETAVKEAENTDEQETQNTVEKDAEKTSSKEAEHTAEKEAEHTDEKKAEKIAKMEAVNTAENETVNTVEKNAEKTSGKEAEHTAGKVEDEHTDEKGE